MRPSGLGAAALESLSPAQRAFLRSLPKAELHAHLNGSIPLETLQDLAVEYSQRPPLDDNLSSSIISTGIKRLKEGMIFAEIDDFFHLFPAVYALTDNPDALRRVTRDVLHAFLDGDEPECFYIELRTTPRESVLMTRIEYLDAVLSEIEKFPADKAALIVSLDRRMSLRVQNDCVAAASALRNAGRRVVGIDLCGDPKAGNVNFCLEPFATARAVGLALTLHIAETQDNSPDETLALLSLKPARVGHATFLNEQAKGIVLQARTCVEICLTSNLLTKTVGSLNDHHIRLYLERDHPVAICTDDTLPFRNSLVGEYALLLARPPLGLGLNEERVAQIAKTSLQSRFTFLPQNEALST